MALRRAVNKKRARFVSMAGGPGGAVIRRVRELCLTGLRGGGVCLVRLQLIYCILIELPSPIQTPPWRLAEHRTAMASPVLLRPPFISLSWRYFRRDGSCRSDGNARTAGAL